MHEYVYIMIGVIAWELEQQLTKPETVRIRIGMTINALLWGALVLVFDDEILGAFKVNEQPEWWIYILLGFFVDIIKSQFLPKEKHARTDSKII